MDKKIIIAVDGYSSCGKSTLAKDLSRKLGYAYIDTGSMYRAVTLYFLENNIPVTGSTPDLEQQLDKISVTLVPNSETGFAEIFLNGRNIEKEIREMNVSQNVSPVSAIIEVRRLLVKMQQEMGKEKCVVMDGRDIGTVVFPQAELKIFMTADPLIRAKRRFEELKAKGMNVTLEEVHENLRSRDYQDSNREDSPLRQAQDAVVLNNSYLNREQQLEFVLKLAQEKIRRED